MKKIFPILILACLFAACGDGSYLYSESRDVNPKGWLHTDSLSYEFDITDTSRIHSLEMDLSHTPDYPYQNIYLQIATEFPSGKRVQQSLNSDLADKTGRWHGDCSNAGCVAHINLQEKALFTEPGKHRIIISQ